MYFPLSSGALSSVRRKKMTTVRWTRALLAGLMAALALLPLSRAAAAGFETIPISLPPTELPAGSACDFPLQFAEEGFLKFNLDRQEAIIHVRQTLTNPATGQSLTVVIDQMVKTVANPDGSFSLIHAGIG